MLESKSKIERSDRFFFLKITFLFSERANERADRKIQEIEANYQSQVTSLRNALELVQDQMEKESQQKVESLIAQHRSEIGIL